MNFFHKTRKKEGEIIRHLKGVQSFGNFPVVVVLLFIWILSVVNFFFGGK